MVFTTGAKPLQMQVLKRVQSSATSFNFQYCLVSLRSSSSCLHFLPCLPIPFIFPYICFPSACFRRALPMQGMTNLVSLSLFYVCLIVWCSFSPWLYVILLHYPLDWPNWSSSPSSSTTFWKFQAVSALFF